MAIKHMFQLLRSCVKMGVLRTVLNVRDLYSWKEGFLFLAYNYLFFNKIEGDYLEFGVYRGRTFSASINMSRDVPCFYNLILPLHIDEWRSRDMSAMRFFAFDSFSGLPETDESELIDEFRRGKLKCSESEFLAQLKKQKAPRKAVITVPGYFEKSLTEQVKIDNKMKKAAFVFIDCDLYESAKSALEFCTDLISDGAVIAFDDWFLFKGNPMKGEHRAFDEWREANKQYAVTSFHNFGWHGKSFLVHHKQEQ